MVRRYAFVEPIAELFAPFSLLSRLKLNHMHNNEKFKQKKTSRYNTRHPPGRRRLLSFVRRSDGHEPYEVIWFMSVRDGVPLQTKIDSERCSVKHLMINLNYNFVLRAV